jgi:hypothetical protein
MGSFGVWGVANELFLETVPSGLNLFDFWANLGVEVLQGLQEGRARSQDGGERSAKPHSA